MNKTLTGLVDVHAHVGINLFNLFKGGVPTTQSLSDLAMKAQLNGIAHVVAFPMPTPFYFDPVTLADTNKRQSSGLEDFPYYLSNRNLLCEAALFGGNVILPFMAIHPVDKVAAQIRFLEVVLEQRKAYGLKLHTLATGTAATALIDSPFTDLMASNNIPILIHSRLYPDLTGPNKVLKLAEKHSNVRVCIAHLADLSREVLCHILDFPNVYVDCAPFLTICQFAREKSPHISGDLLPLDYRDPVRCLVELHALLPGRLVWGTDEPWTSQSDSETGELISHYTYRDECSLLTQLSQIGCHDVKYHIATHNTQRFLFGTPGGLSSPK
jgi:predicted TIM-barrel fold metal-dependent hydrolase